MTKLVPQGKCKLMYTNCVCVRARARFSGVQASLDWWSVISVPSGLSPGLFLSPYNNLTSIWNKSCIRKSLAKIFHVKGSRVNECAEVTSASPSVSRVDSEGMCLQGYFGPVPQIKILKLGSSFVMLPFNSRCKTPFVRSKPPKYYQSNTIHPQINDWF